MSKTTQKPSVTMLAIGAVAALAGAYAAHTFLSPIVIGWFGAKPDMHKLIVDMAEKFNKSYPKMIDAVTRVERIVPEEGNAFTYHMTITAAVSLNDLNVSGIQQKIKSQYCSSSGMKNLRDAGTRISWAYHNPSGQYLTKVTMDPDQCK